MDSSLARAETGSMITEALLKTEQGKLYLNKLCRHFAREVPATVIGSQGRIDPPFGLCRIRVMDQHMHLHVDVDSGRDIDKAERIVAEQLSHIARKDKPNLQWKRDY